MRSESIIARSGRKLWQLAGLVVLAAAVGAAVGALVATSISDGSSHSKPDLSVAERVEAINGLFGAEWPRVDYPEDWYNAIYNTQTPLEGEWFERLSERIRIDGVDIGRSKIEDWREQYAAWVEETGDVLRELPLSDPHYDSTEAVHSRGLRILAHVDVLLSE